MAVTMCPSSEMAPASGAIMPVSIWKVVVFARAVGTQKAHHFAAIQLQGDVLDHPASGEGLHQMLRRKHGLLFEIAWVRAAICRPCPNRFRQHFDPVADTMTRVLACTGVRIRLAGLKKCYRLLREARFRNREIRGFFRTAP